MPSILNRVFNFWGIIYIIAIFVTYLHGYKEAIPHYMLSLQVIIAVAYFISFHFCIKLESKRSIFCFIFLNFLAFSLLLRYTFIECTGDAYANIIGNDSYKYERNALRFIDKDYMTFVKGIINRGPMNIDDLGYSSIIYFITRFFQDINWARNAVLLLNSLAITYSSYFIYRLCTILNLSDRLALSAAIIYGLFPFFYVSSAVGLKENIFCFLIIGSFYYMYKYKQKRVFTAFLSSCIFILLTFFFRSAITLMLIFSYIPLLYCNQYNRKKSIYIGILCGGILISLLPIIVLEFTGISMEHVSRVTEARLTRTGESKITQWLIQILSSTIGPFPNFTRAAQYGIYHNSGLLLKCFLSFFTYIGAYQALKKLEYQFYPIILFLLMGYSMLVLSGVALDMRYHVTFLFAFMIMAIKGIQEYIPNNKYLLYPYTICCILIITFYNIR